jgi:hypothetical protein
MPDPKEKKHEKPTIYFVDTGNLKKMSFEVIEGNIPTATFGAGVTIFEATHFLQNLTDASHPHGYSFINMTGPGELSIGGVLAIGGHGTSVPFEYKGKIDPAFCSCLSNLIRSFKAIVSVIHDGKVVYEEKTFHRSERESAAFLVHLGRAFITEVTMQVVPNYFLEVHNMYPEDTELYQAPQAKLSENALQSLVTRYGRLEVIHFPFTSHPWVKVWKRVDGFTENPVHEPYNYKFANCITNKTSDTIQKIFNDDPDLTPLLAKVFLLISRLSHHGSKNWVMSGLSKDLLLYVGNNTLRITALGYVVLIRKEDIQKTIYTYITKYNEMLEKYKARGQFPVNSPLEIRFTSLDDPSPLHIEGATPPLLAATAPPDPASKQEYDTVFWVDILTLPRTKGAAEFFEEMEIWMYDTWKGALRPEWSKGWGFDKKGGWQNPTILQKHIPEFYKNTIEEAREILHKYDQGNLYTNRVLSQILPPK